MKKVKLSLKPHEILQDPLLNKGTAFLEEERDALGLHGFLPCHVSSVEEQIERNYRNFTKKRTPIGKYAFLTDLLNRNEILFYQFAEKYLLEIMPIIYTPTVGEASLQYSMIYKERRGLYISYPKQDRIEEIIQNLPNEHIEVAVVTDGERILGLGDQGIGGMAIPVGKLALYTLFGGVHPAKTLPILLDVGTNNPELLKSDIYLGWKHERIVGEKYHAFIKRFVNALKKRFPRVLLQWEDFGKQNAKEILNRYRKEILSFNDDIQGTAAVVVAALYGASRRAKIPFKEHKIAILGGGSAGVGIAEFLKKALIQEGLSEKEAAARIYIVDVSGLLHSQLSSLDEGQKAFAKTPQEIGGWKGASEHISLLDVVREARPTTLIGVCAQSGAFSEEIVKEMAKHTPHPIIFPLSNPTSKAEALPEEILKWTKGKGIIATGSPFPSVLYEGKTYRIGQCNNAYIYPGIGLGAIASKATQITDKMFLEAAKTLAASILKPEEMTASLFAEISEIKTISKKIALSVASAAMEEGVAPSASMKEMEKRIEENFWRPHYDLYERA